MKLEQALRNDQELVNQICTSTSTEKLLDYCKDKGYSISASDLRAAFQITGDTTDDQLMGEIQKNIQRELTARCEYGEDEELKGVSGGLVLTTTALAIIGSAAIGSGTSLGIFFGTKKNNKKAAEKQHEYTMEQMNEQARLQKELMDYEVELRNRQ